MKVVLLNPRGHCAGVDMAMECLNLVLMHHGSPVYVYHEIVHNRQVVEDFRARGAVFVDDLDEVPIGAVLVFSAHGVSPAVRIRAKERKLQTIDATCPLVAKVHSEVLRFSRAGYKIILIGHRRHDEVVGVVGEAPDSITLVETIADVDRLSFGRGQKLAWLTQTTLSVDDCDRITDRLRSRFPNIVGPPKDDICYATQNRQQSLREHCDQADVVVVVGSQNSSNSRRLAELAKDRQVTTYLVDSSAQLDVDSFSNEQTVLLTAGASAPETTVQEVLRWFVDRFDAVAEERTGVVENQLFALPPEVRSWHRSSELPLSIGIER